MNTNTITPCFKGERQYITGADIYNLSISYLLSIEQKSFLNIDLSFHQLTSSNLNLLPKEKFDTDQNEVALLKIKTKTSEKSYFIVETGEQVNCRLPFDEESIVKASSFDPEEKLITLERFQQFTFIEKAVALNKSLLKQIYPEVKGKWYFVKIKLFGKTLENLNPSKITLKFRKNLNFKITDSMIFADHEKVGSIYFSLK